MSGRLESSKASILDENQWQSGPRPFQTKYLPPYLCTRTSSTLMLMCLTCECLTTAQVQHRSNHGHLVAAHSQEAWSVLPGEPMIFGHLTAHEGTGGSSDSGAQLEPAHTDASHSLHDPIKPHECYARKSSFLRHGDGRGEQLDRGKEGIVEQIGHERWGFPTRLMQRSGA